MNQITLAQFREITKDMPEDSIICVPFEHKPTSIPCQVNFVRLTIKEHSYGDSDLITLGMDENGRELKVKKLVGQNTWDVIG